MSFDTITPDVTMPRIGRGGLKKSKPLSEAGEEGAAQSFAIDKNKMTEYVPRIENLYADLATEKSESMTRCKIIHADIKALYGDAKKDGLPTRPLKAIVKQRAIQRKLDAIRENMEDDDASLFDIMRSALGDLADLPLGEHALNQVN